MQVINLSRSDIIRDTIHSLHIGLDLQLGNAVLTVTKDVSCPGHGQTETAKTGDGRGVVVSLELQLEDATTLSQ